MVSQLLIKAGTKPVLFLHMGMPKTGTTALQYMLASNDDFLMQGILYFKSFVDEEGIAQHNILDAFINDPRHTAEQLYTEYLVCSETLSIHTCILSTEKLTNCFLDKNLFKKLLVWLHELSHYFTLVPIIVLRDLSSFILSIYTQNLLHTTDKISPLVYASYIMGECPIFIDSLTEFISAYPEIVINFYSNSVINELFSLMIGDAVQIVERNDGQASRLPYISFYMLVKSLDLILPLDFKNVILYEPTFENRINTFHDLITTQVGLVETKDEILVFNLEFQLFRHFISKRIENRCQDEFTEEEVAVRLNKNKLNAFFRYQVENFSIEHILILETFWKCSLTNYLHYELISFLLRIYPEVSTFLDIKYPSFVEQLIKYQHHLSIGSSIEGESKFFYVNKGVNYISKQPFFGYGFHELENQFDQYFRWTGPGLVSGVPFYSNGLFSCEFTVTYHFPNNYSSRLDFHINGVLIYPDLYEVAGNYSAKFFYVNPDSYSGPIVLEFKTDVVIDTEDDKRMRGLIISNISVNSIVLLEGDN
jgi:hypothetical protein